jgi:hypothetical protein
MANSSPNNHLRYILAPIPSPTPTYSLNHRSQPTTRQPNLCNPIDHTDRILILWQIPRTRIRSLDTRRTRIDRRERCRANLKRSMLVVRNLVRVSRVPVTCSEDRPGLVWSAHPPTLPSKTTATHLREHLGIARRGINQSPRKHGSRSVHPSLREHAHSRPQS